MNTHKNVVTKNTRKSPEQIRHELETRVARLKARPVEPEIARSVALRESVADHVFEIMQEQGITQAELARRMGKSRAHVCKILGGANLTLDSLASLSVALGCEVDLQFGNNEPTTANAKLSDWEHIKRPEFKLIQGGLPTQPSWKEKKMPTFERERHFISINNQPTNHLITDQMVSGEELEIAA